MYSPVAAPDAVSPFIPGAVRHGEFRPSAESLIRLLIEIPACIE